MSRPHSSGPKRQSEPYKDFPLTWHPKGRWVKKIRGTLHYFGGRDATAQEALDEYLRTRDDLQAGRIPAPNSTGMTIKDAANRFLADREARLRIGDLTQRSWDDYHATCVRLIKHFGVGRLTADLKPHDFATLRESMSKTWGPTTIAGEITRIRVFFKFLYESALLEQETAPGNWPFRSMLPVARRTSDTRVQSSRQLDRAALTTDRPRRPGDAHRGAKEPAGGVGRAAQTPATG